MNRPVVIMASLLAACLGGMAAAADDVVHHGHHPMAQPGATAPYPQTMQDARQLVQFPTPLRIHTLANMRDHLQTLGDIQAALATGAFDKASDLAEQRLGMSSLEMHGAHEVEKYMPKGMQEAGTAMHRSASQFALVVKDASATADLKPVLAAMSRLSQTCVACHAGYRLQ
jgi:hypothetical protein